MLARDEVPGLEKVETLEQADLITYVSEVGRELEFVRTARDVDFASTMVDCNVAKDGRQYKLS